jgi:hypothetical protein
MRRWRIRYLRTRAWLERLPWLLITAVALMAGTVVLLTRFEELPWFIGMRGNLLGEVVGGVVFLLLTLHLGRKVEGIIIRRARLDEQREIMQRFIEFLESEAHYNVCFPALATKNQPHGLIYRLEPARHLGKAAKRETEIYTLYVVRVARPAYEDVLTPEQLADYERSPIRKGGLYFCDFFNGEWHMGPSTSRREWLELQLFGKQGEMELSVTAEEFYAELTRGPATPSSCR